MRLGSVAYEEEKSSRVDKMKFKVASVDQFIL
jgi:hypothetical protein